MKRINRIGIALACAILFTTLVLFSYQQQAAAQITPETPTESDTESDTGSEVVAITPLRLDGQVVLSVTVRVGEDLTVTTPITLDVASWIADLEGGTAITAGVAAVGEPTTTVTGALSAVLTPTLTTTVDVTVTGLITPVLSLVEIIEEVEDDADGEPVLRGEVLFASNLREGPGTDTAIIGNAQPGDIVVIVDTNAAGDWYNLDNEAWIAGFLVELLDEDEAVEDEADATESVDEADEADEAEVDEDAADDAATQEDTGGDAAPVPTPTPTGQPADEDTGADAAENDAADDSATLLDYRVAVITGLLNLASGVEAMGSLMDEPQMLSADWNDSMKLQAEVIRGSYQDISTLTAPTAATAFHADLLAAVADCDVAMELLTIGLDSLDMDSLDQAATLMVQCGGKMESVIANYPEFLE